MSGRSVGKRLVYDVEPIMPITPANGEQCHYSFISFCDDIDPSIFAPSREYMSWKLDMWVDFFLVLESGVTERLQRICDQRSESVPNEIVWLQGSNRRMLPVKADVCTQFLSLDSQFFG